MRPTLFAIAWIVALSGCARAPDGPPIVLRQPSHVPHIVKRTVPAKTATAVSAQGATVPLSPSDKEALFRAFDTYLDQARPQK